jgi:hypothetical protein
LTCQKMAKTLRLGIIAYLRVKYYDRGSVNTS